ncbi:helix-turn-helix domain-containing protein [Micromonospora halotolerans]|uniref:Helix-turn-helix domain-containing protein n=1 Tax=Micromonospora halotolerans TaxID=709879 RepID=A0ABY9ZUQ8_9ACTN|nr:helix-turn-helix domain-containing protein [Micromonospora halotolerans]WNM38740.1 helix-turn-helix domain-containing protein [Micromonospora halotolerans]
MTDSQPLRRRAPGMSPDERRAMIVRAALPLLATHGAAVTTAQVARAAGIGEATVFRAFPDKDTLLDAAVAEALRPDTALAELAAIPLDQPLADRLTAAATALLAHLDRLGAVLAVAHTAGRPGRGRRATTGDQPPPDSTAGSRRATTEDQPPPDSAAASRRATTGDHRPLDGSARQESAAATRAAVAALFAPEGDRLRLPADRLAALFLAVLLPGRPPLADDRPTPTELVDLFLHGALAPAAAEESR